jgi:hypothetical protein
MKPLFILALGICTLASFSQTKNTPCRKLDEVLKKTFEAMNKRDSKLFVSLVDKDILLDAFEEEAEMDTSAMMTYQVYRAYPRLIFKEAKSSFHDLLKRLDKEFAPLKWAIELVDYEIVYQPPYRANPYYDLDLTIRINGQLYHVSSYVYSSKKCYCTFDPFYPEAHEEYEETGQ